MQMRNTIVAVLMALVFCHASFAEEGGPGIGSTGSINPDIYLDYRIEVRSKRVSGYMLKYDTNKPIIHLSQINVERHAFDNQADAEQFILDHPSYTILDRGWCRIESDEWIEVDLLGSYAQAAAKQQEIRNDNNWTVEVRITAVYSPIIYGGGFAMGFGF